VEAMEVSELTSQYDSDLEFNDSFQDPQPPFQKRNGRLHNGNIFCLPVGTIRDKILHDAVASGHRGISKTKASMSKSYYWSTL
jgi:Integrase zinc binding domain